ncbi:hypothetical protein BH09BAC5_BH09BAC5_15240 [soil metagenome]
MKKLFLRTMVLFVPFWSFFSIKTQAQGSIQIINESHQIQQYCIVPATGIFYFGALTSGYTITDSIDFYVDFGDGNFSTSRLPQNFYSPTEAYTGFSLNTFTHSYMTAGIFHVVYAATMPDGNTDTASASMMVTTACNNVTGRVYLDMNNDCMFNSGDSVQQYYDIKLKYNGDLVYWGITDNSGFYSIPACPGYTYTLSGGQQGYPQITWNCSTAQTQTISPNPSANRDFIMHDSTAMELFFSMDSISSNCIPMTASLDVAGVTFLFSPLDTIQVTIDFGDATDTTILSPVSMLGGGQFGSFGAIVNHTYTIPGTYSVVYSAITQNGLTDTISRMNAFTIYDCGPAGFSEQKLITTNIFPNPADNLIEINTSLIGTYKISDLSGKIISSGKIENQETIINSSSIADGIYFFTIYSEKGISTNKIVVQH